MDGNVVRARLGEGLEIGIARLDHQVAVERLVGMRPQRRDDRGPKVTLGTKWPSITSRWIQSAPAAATARTSSASLEKSADRIEGAMITGRGKGVDLRVVGLPMGGTPPQVNAGTSRSSDTAIRHVI